MKSTASWLIIASLQTAALVNAYPSRQASASTGSNWRLEQDAPSNYHNNSGMLQYVNPHIGTYGITPNGNGGMIPSVSVPFGMTRWTAQTRENYISQVPYNDLDSYIHGFQATHQPAIWMGELGQTIIAPGWSEEIKPAFEQRGFAFSKADEVSTPYVYEVVLDADTTGEHDYNLTEQYAGQGPDPGGAGSVPDAVWEATNGRSRRKREDADSEYARSIHVAMTALAHAGYLRLDFEDSSKTSGNETAIEPYVLIQATRLNWTGQITIDLENREISGYNPQRQDYLLGPDKPDSFKGYFVSRFSQPFTSYGTTLGRNSSESMKTATGENLGAYVRFASNTTRVEVRTGISFVSIEQARRNLDIEIPDGTAFETTVEQVKSAWKEKLDRVTIEGVNTTDSDHDQRTIWYTGLFHALQYPNDYSEPLGNGSFAFYNGYTDSVQVTNESYHQSWSIWDTYRAEHSILTLFAPERVNIMMWTLLKIYNWTTRLPMWANMVETNIMIATNADAVLANALSRGFRSFDIPTAWAAVKRDAYDPPDNDTELLYFDREANTPYEVRAGLTSYMARGWVADDGWAEATSRTLDYAFDDYACAVVARAAGEDGEAEALEKRSKNYRNLWNSDSEFMQARNANGTWANSTFGWTEGDQWIYTFDVMHDIPGLVGLFENKTAGLRAKLDEHFDGGHNDQSNEPSHHIPYLYSAIGDQASTATRVRSIAYDTYNATSAGLDGNEDLGQMSAWYLFSALGFYPVNSASDEYIVCSPFFEKVTIRLPAGAATGGEGGTEHELVISAPGAPTKPYVKSLTVDGRAINTTVLKHGDIVNARSIAFEMSETPTSWGQQ
ncbi:glycoside hydrolase family 92 protein [Xylariaceae sp. FL0255]|nr:glycoside hydrolase family 92 protein [Xylariaceae sp. FL0255]